MMQLFEVTNGYTGYGSVKILILAKSEEDAFAVAQEEYKKEAQGKYESGYWENLKVTILCEDTTKSWHGEISDE